MDGGGGEMRTVAEVGGVAKMENSLPASKGPDKSKRDEWSEGGVVNLLEAYESKWSLRNRAKLKGTDWEEIARQVSARSSGTRGVKTPNQCKNKIESMKKRYRSESAAAAAHQNYQPSSSWQFYGRMDGLLKGTAMNANSSMPQIGPENPQPLPKVEVESEAEGTKVPEQNIEEEDDDGSNTLPSPNNNNEEEIGHKDDSRGSGSTPVGGGNGGRRCDRAKKRRGVGSEVAESIRLLAHSMLQIEQGRMEVCKEIEMMKAEADVKRAQMELRRTEIIAETQLQIARILSRRTSSGGGSRSSPAMPELDGIGRGN